MRRWRRAVDPDANPLIPDAAPDAVFDETITLAAGEANEGKWVAGPDDRIVLGLTAPADFTWNVHAHLGGSVATLGEGADVTTVDFEILPTEAADWFVFVRNLGADPLDVTVHMEIFGTATREGFL